VRKIGKGDGSRRAAVMSGNHQRYEFALTSFGEEMARKSKKTKQSRKRKRKQKRFAGLKRKLEQGPHRGEKILIEPSGEEKMSEVLTDFVEPYLEFADTDEAHRKLLTLAIMAWNASFLPEKEQQDMINRVLDTGIPTGADELKAGLKEIVNMLIIRKKVYFSGHTRKIIDYELTDRGRDYHLAVASTLE
jgi:hypothetical protein